MDTGDEAMACLPPPWLLAELGSPALLATLSNVGLFKKFLLLGGVPVRPTTKRERFQDATQAQAEFQSELMADQAADLQLRRTVQRGIESAYGPSSRKAGPAAASTSEAPSDWVTKLERLAELHAAGALTDAEFADLKASALREVGE